MAAGRESPDSEAIRVNIEFFRSSPHGANRPLCVLQRRGMVVFRPTVLQNERRHSDVVEPVGDLSSFMIHGEIAVPPPGQTMTAAPLALEGSARRIVKEGLSLSVSPSAPGAPPGQRSSTFCATATHVKTRNKPSVRITIRDEDIT